ncbi:MAG: hypothetical protein J6Y82_01210 [Bacteroidales bacterium]|nr:hypothetical protein [Bacteroidales bacterium]
MSIDVLKETIRKVNMQNSVSPTIFGHLRNSINDNIVIYDSDNESIDTIIVYYKEGVLVRMSFAGAKLQIDITELIVYLGNYYQTYNYRDNYTQFSFYSNKIGNTIKRLLFKRDNKIEYDRISNNYTEETPSGQTIKIAPEKMNFNNFILEFAL